MSLGLKHVSCHDATKEVIELWFVFRLGYKHLFVAGKLSWGKQIHYIFVDDALRCKLLFFTYGNTH